MLLPVTLVDHLTQLAKLRERGEVREGRALVACRPGVPDVLQHGDLPVQVGRLLRPVSHAEPGAVTCRGSRLRQAAIAHEPAQDDLPLRSAEQVLLGEHHPVARGYLACFAPAARRADQVV